MRRVGPAIFVDRDGTLIHDVDYLSRIEDVRWFPWTVDALRLLKRAGYLLFVTTNQGGVGLGYYPEQFVIDTHTAMHRMLLRAGVEIDGWFYCPHHPKAVRPEWQTPCLCRKPARGMADQAGKTHAIDFGRSWAVGDKLSDVDFGRGFGGQGILVRTGHGESELARLSGTVPGAACVANDLMEATSWLLRAG